MRVFVPGLRAVLALGGGVVTGMLLASCGGNAQPAIMTLVPSATLTAAPVAAVVPTVTITPLPTHPTTTPSPGPSPTNPLAPTLSPAPATLTVTRVPTVAGLSVEYFTTDTEYAKPGDNVTLFWSIRGADRARIYRLDAGGERIWRWDVNTSGQLTVGTRSADRDVARFSLEGEVAGSTVEQILLIPLQCPEVWFFDPAPESCPAEPPQITLQAEQTFERGRMIWVETQDRIYVVFEDGASPAWAQYPDNFSDGDPERDDSLVPPEGLQQPIRGFGLVWRTNPRVQDRLGWATTPEVAFDGMFQADSSEPSVAAVYLRLRDGGIMALDAYNDAWDVLPESGAAP